MEYPIVNASLLLEKVSPIVIDMHQPEHNAPQHLPENNTLEAEGLDSQSESVRSLSREPGSPSASFGPTTQLTAAPNQEKAAPIQRIASPTQLAAGPVQQANAPLQRQTAPGQNAPLQLKPSTEVPDLDEAVVTKVNAFLKAGKSQEAINEIMKALAAKDPAKFDLTALDGGKVHHTYSSSAHAALGPKAKAWLQAALKKGPPKIKTDKAEMRKYLDSLTLPKDQMDFHVEISENFCNNAANLYSSIRHEFVHVAQKKANPFKYLSTSEIGSGWANPSTDYQHGMNEFEAYGWEADNLTQTGLDQRPGDVWNVYKQLAKHGPSSTSDPKNNKLWKQKLEKLWNTAFSSLLTRAEGAIVKAKAGTLDATGQKQLDDDHYQLKDLWGYRHHYPTSAGKLKARYEAVNGYYAGKKFVESMKKAEKDIKSVTSPLGGYNIWDNLSDEWRNLGGTLQKAHKAEYSRIMPIIWTKAFDLIIAEVDKLYKADPKDSRIPRYLSRTWQILAYATDSMVDAKLKAAKQKIHDDWKKKTK